ncbi:hypothetical protein FOPG_17452 [Fusarium oxysporum f. sp. conglutinans race 2 54008]|uniref:NmrA-like domain-containing protein n=3 Tax=Fusarium oxysporum f. sp. conglutinans TaxID=100902 RepID=A0A8H6G859_FUSOX|nr:hypothetical protein FOXB_00966 [Fusarium oxysporum f. sp. conglutinans Fo5176]EXL66364.1 hypothetical protein FOPG_17452 [Fusarium oxysporum f. sp. conglutinans race 2 54008]KAF6512996.1 hypothetical protein HZS61_007254 [Fusarium oxysporum f. sp. conglutinans]KAI8396284.1 hypothetical protein FOFC_20831 [Fusarium oxysporum]
MAPSILIAGPTGNTGRSLVETLSKLLVSSDAFSGWKILALTRSSSGAAAQKLAKLPRVEIMEQNWVNITAGWLREHNVKRAFIAPQSLPNQFAEESTFHVAALNGGVEYVVRISTTFSNVRPDCLAFNARAHWAIEAMLSTPEFERLQWTSIQPNFFAQTALTPAVELINNYRKTGKQSTLRLFPAEDSPLALIDSDDIGILAAHLLFSDDLNVHNKAKYVLNGPEDITGREIVAIIEKHLGTQVEDVVFKDTSTIDQIAAAFPDSEHLILSIKDAVGTAWDGKLIASATSREVLRIAAPKGTPAGVLKRLLDS